MAEIILNKHNFKEKVLDADKTVLVDFFATWCGPCRMVAPIVEEIADEYKDSMLVGKINIDEEPELASQFSVASIPTLMVFKNGKVVSTEVGYRGKKEIEKMIE